MNDRTAGPLTIDGRPIGADAEVYVIAELSANHNQDFDHAVELIRMAKQAGADAVKLQTYTPDTLTIRSERECFRIEGGTLWDGRTLYDLYADAQMPWSWQPRLKAVADELGITCFSSAFDATSVDFLEEMGMPAHKIASFELVDLPLIERVARTGKPLLLSTGMATLAEIEEAVQTARQAGATQIGLLKCTSAYPAPAEEMNLRTIPHLAEAFGVPVGLSDHTMGTAAAVAAVALGACLVEKHVCLSRDEGGPDSPFSATPDELRRLIEDVRNVRRAIGGVQYGTSPKENASRVFRRSLFVVADMEAGEPFGPKNVRSIRPGHGLPPKYLTEVLGRCAAADITRGTPLTWRLVGEPQLSDES
ncbi:MAG: pseudaminic acid synthase [Thermoguttaceae bacterium]